MVAVLGTSGRKHRCLVAPVHILPKGLAVEPIVRVFTRMRRIRTLSAGLAALFLGLNVLSGPISHPAPVFAQNGGDEAENQGDSLPEVPAERLNIDESQYDPPLTDAEKMQQWKRSNGEVKFKTALKAEGLGNADRETITKAVQYYLYSMTVKEERGRLQAIAEKLLDAVNSPRLTTNDARRYANDEIVRIARELLNQPREVRLNALVLAASLMEDPSAEPPRPYAGAIPLFVDVLNDPEQFVDSKIWAVLGLARICRGGNIGVTERNTAAVNLVAALNAPDAAKPENWWYRFRIVYALGDTGLAYNLERQPIVIDALVGVLANRKENWMIRSEAARSVTRIPWQRADSVNVPLVTYLVSQLARDMAAARNANLKAPYWRYCFVQVYLSFKPHGAAERENNLSLLEQVTRPHLASNQPMVQAAYDAVMPVVNSVTGSPLLNPAPTSPDALNALDEWLKDNVPDDRKPTPSSKQVDGSERGASPMADNLRPRQ